MEQGAFTGEKFETVKVAVANGKSLNDVIKEMTVYRRHIVRYNRADVSLPTIFNEYMHLSWDSPNEDQTFKIAKEVSKFGVDYYVIDCGWHNEEDGNIIYPYVGQWKESKKRFPHGIKYTIDYIHSLGMKAGLWLEPEIIGYLCEECRSIIRTIAFLSGTENALRKWAGSSLISEIRSKRLSDRNGTQAR